MAVSSVLFISILSTLLLVSQTVANSSLGLLGVEKKNLHLYQEKNGQFICLDGSKKIPFSAINDDYCDCPDGSDEPGTSACPNGKFYCANEGHIPAYIRSSRVNDGVCDAECCDGTDEYDGKIQCPNLCKEVGKEHRKMLRQIAAIQSEGARIKREYIKFGKEKKKKAQIELAKLEAEIIVLKERLGEVQSEKEKLEKEEQEAKSKSAKKTLQCPIECSSNARDTLFTLRSQVRERVEKLQEKVNQFDEHVDRLLQVLRDLKANHNQNYHDMAVKEAVTALEEFEREFEKEETIVGDGGEANEVESETVDEELDGLFNEAIEKIETTNVEVVENGQMDEETTEIVRGKSSVSRLLNVILPSRVQEFIGSLARRVQQSLHIRFIGVTRYDADTARREFDKIDEKVREVERRISENKAELEKDYGPEEEWAKLNGECLSFDSGEYTYSVCLFGSATQKSNRDYASTHLGSFERWAGSGEKGTLEYYSGQLYEHGTRCWNGPERSVKVSIECGKENKITSVTEPEKCEYFIKMMSPAACPLEAQTINQQAHQENGVERSQEKPQANEHKHEEL
ncbi:uncharacterized protein VTP21DRAFT_7069 [Calcarisporiella thermophila]|uniref:uncharacterized protein n=1 Tax=Calcarisporiella thermophila TaxID=911321 RepID=UPI003742E036